MRKGGVAQPDGTGFAGGVVADGDDDVHVWRAFKRELVPALAADVRHVITDGLCQLGGHRLHGTAGVAARTERVEAALSQHVEDRLGHDAARGVAGAQEQHVVGVVGHAKFSGCSQEWFPPRWRGCRYARSAPAAVLGEEAE